eukprot:GHVP01047717.1.p1 GENE.GHVP01047717.1~~GHVP01047717.1.p1  ORF type:complete len:316 (+),score=51.96 GHVP01047717.1:15-962(+)
MQIEAAAGIFGFEDSLSALSEALDGRMYAFRQVAAHRNITNPVYNAERDIGIMRAGIEPKPADVRIPSNIPAYAKIRGQKVAEKLPTKVEARDESLQKLMYRTPYSAVSHKELVHGAEFTGKSNWFVCKNELSLSAAHVGMPSTIAAHENICGEAKYLAASTALLALQISTSSKEVAEYLKNPNGWSPSTSPKQVAEYLKNPHGWSPPTSPKGLAEYLKNPYDWKANTHSQPKLGFDFVSDKLSGVSKIVKTWRPEISSHELGDLILTIQQAFSTKTPFPDHKDKQRRSLERLCWNWNKKIAKQHSEASTSMESI